MSERTLYWRGKLAEWESSGLSRAAFCRRHRINYQTMTSWVKRFRDEGGAGSLRSAGRVHKAAGFVEVSLPTASTLSSYEVLLGDDHRSESAATSTKKRWRG